MVGPVKSQKASSIDNIQITYAVMTPHSRKVPLKIMNTSNDPIELVAGTNVAEFSPLVNTASPKRTEFGKVGTSVTRAWGCRYSAEHETTMSRSG